MLATNVLWSGERPWTGPRWSCHPDQHSTFPVWHFFAPKPLGPGSPTDSSHSCVQAAESAWYLSIASYVHAAPFVLPDI